MSGTIHYGNVRILLVEDEPLIALDCETALRAQGVGDIVYVPSVSEAEKLLDAGNVSFDAAIMDFSFGESTGLTLVRKLQDLGVAVGLMTGYSRAHLPSKLKNLPFLGKPFSHAELQAMLMALLSGTGPGPGRPAT